MGRDHRKLRVFHEADLLIIDIYRASKDFPPDERFGLRLQLRRAAVSIASNIVEGSARRTDAEYLNFLNVAMGSSAEVSYLLGLTYRLAFISTTVFQQLEERANHLTAGLQALINSLSQRSQT
jgi:four helix bundle protein